ncbi:MAG: HIT domain-containing protein [Gammaproteobacteria bacterium]|nr:HIT domain-containing protein [Gammaproteobacteria bacterium]
MLSGFQLDARLQQDTITICEDDKLLCLLMNDQRYPWVILVPRQPDLAELHELPPAQYHELMEISWQLGQDLMALFQGDKLNVAAIGNIVRQLHIHHVVRTVEDASWPAPVWGVGKAIPYTPDQLDARLQELRRSLRLAQSY